MSPRKVAICLSLSLVAGCSAAQPSTDATAAPSTAMAATANASADDIRHPDIDRYIRAQAARDEFRGVVLVAHRGRIVHHAAYGSADLDTGTPNTQDTAFLIGSLTKSFTAATVMQLVEDGRLDLQTPISAYLPGLDRRLGDRLTLHLLLKQRSGLPSHLEDIAALGSDEVSSAEILAMINRADLWFAPGSRYEYSNLNYHLAALVIEAVEHKPFADVLRERTFAPLGMARSGVEAYGDPPAHRALGYRRALTGWRHDENNISYTLGSGDVYATAADLLAWSRALDDGRYVSNASRKAMFSGGDAAAGYYGYGFRIQPYRRAGGGTGTLARHGGSMDGFLSNLHKYLEDDLTVIVLANQRPFEIRDFTLRVKQIALGLPDTDRESSGIE